MNVNFSYEEAGKADKIVFEQIFAEKPGGGVVANPSFDIMPGTAIGKNSDGKFVPVKSYKLVAAVTSSDTTIKIEKGSGIANGDIIAHGAKGVACTAVSKTNADYDTVTVTLGVAVAKGTNLYQAASASADAAEPKYKPLYVTGAPIYAGKGDQLVKLVNGANLRKETAPIADELVALIPTITLV